MSNDQEQNLKSIQNTISIYQKTSLLLNPTHYHAFTKISLSITTKKCIGCQKSLFRNPFFSSNAEESLVKCLVCGVIAHRSCSFHKDMGVCSVYLDKIKNGDIMDNNEMMLKTGVVDKTDKGKQEDIINKIDCNDAPSIDENSEILVDKISSSEKSIVLNNRDNNNGYENTFDNKDENMTDNSIGENDSILNNITTKISKEAINNDSTGAKVSKDDFTHNQEQEILMNLLNDTPKETKPPPKIFASKQKELIWSEEGPPSHWAINEPDKLSGIIPYEDDGITTHTEEETIDKEENLQFVSRILHENLVSYFQRLMALTNKDKKADNDDYGNDVIGINEMIINNDEDKANNEDDTISTSTQDEKDNTASITVSPSTKATSEEIQTPIDLTAFLTTQQKQKISFFNGTKQTITASKKLSTLAPKLTMASLAGGLAGSVVGFALCTSAPVACIVAPFVGRYCSVVGVLLLEGSVIVSGFHAGYQTVQNSVEDGYRVLTLFQQSKEDKVVMLRPNVSISTQEWENRTSSILKTTTLPSTNNQDEKNKQIINEELISNESKIFLLISRILTGKNTTIVGKVYHNLIDFYYERITRRDLVDDVVVKENVNDAETEKEMVHRERRIDAHAVIHYTIKTLFQDKPNLLSDKLVSTLSINSIEEIVLNELYLSLYEEIRFEFYEKDNKLSSNIHLFLKSEVYNPTEDGYPVCISIQAIHCIRLITDARSAIQKLKYCIEFIEIISLSYSKKQTTTPSAAASETNLMCADSLLTLVCQHIIYAEIPNMNAEIAFIEEFIRDEYLLKGIEGYVLVTFQASLSFLNDCCLEDFKELFV